jgi:hypothetical protein
MKKRIDLLIVATAALWMVQGMACAEEPAPTEPKKELYGKLKRADTDQDGKVSYEEYRTIEEIKIRQRFEKLDANGDGFVDIEEQHSERDPVPEKMSPDGSGSGAGVKEPKPAAKRGKLEDRK